MTGTGVHLFKIPNAAFCLPSSVTLQSTKESICVWKLGWNTLSFLFYINVKSRKIELSSIFYQKRRARSFPRSEIFSEGQVDATLVLILSSALRKFTYAISSHIRLNTLMKTNRHTHRQTEKPQSDLLGSLQEPKMVRTSRVGVKHKVEIVQVSAHLDQLS